MISTPLLSLLILLLIAGISGLFTSWLRWCLGNILTGINADPEPAKVEFAGRIFSTLGAWLAKRYSQFEQKEKARTEALFSDQFRQLGVWILACIKEGWESENEEDKEALKEAVEVEGARRRQALMDAMKLAQKPNPFKALGVCAVCTSFWVYLLATIVAMLTGVLPFGWALFFFPAIAPTAAHVAARTGLD